MRLGGGDVKFEISLQSDAVAKVQKNVNSNIRKNNDVYHIMMDNI